MRIIFCLLYLLISSDVVFCLERDDSVKTKFNIYSGIQLSATKWSIPVAAEIFRRNNLYYAGAKIPVSTNNIYGYFPVGAIGGYGYRLIQNEKWKAAVLLDAQWLGSKAKNQIKPTHYFDFTLNYQLTYVRWKKIRLKSSFGYGMFVKCFFRSDTEIWQNNAGISGLIRLSAVYLL